MTETEVRECPECGAKMIEGSDRTLGDAFRCNRPKPKRLERNTYRIQPYVCDKCGYIEFHQEKGKVVSRD
jgi:predicted RNA-binding Zn-ribbon protein involved in translation (DUF1610 family)